MGALWGSADIARMDAQGKLASLVISMSKHPDSLDLDGPLREKQTEARAASSPTLIFEGSVRDLAPLAPRNVNSMATGAIAARHSLGFDGVVGRLVADPSLDEMVRLAPPRRARSRAARAHRARAAAAGC